ncbi:class I SAM-dependent methyltransferase [Enteractinococcus helveticum]|uniref:SAM-dependent methyltransferase n=1 Tax=Enteractinococcus helveticum TaxID=1837282 RepID=A0A1B7LWE0_9MICC|nr:class I SAM-dependent methyltransferase [Enteractinococcus helveticum]OAV59350.1 SAM-dependent methyltransferase [Enteractinococcus helveticum]
MSDSTASELAGALTPEGFKLLNELWRSGEYASADTLTLAERLRAQGYAPPIVNSVLTQLKLRTQAAAKFGPFVEQMLFTDAGLQQATSLQVAAHHARRFARAGVDEVIDLGSGLGADALAIAGLDIAVTAVEIDETTAAATTINLMPFPHASVEVADAVQWVLDHPAAEGTARGYWLDPARRQTLSSGTVRIFDPEAFSPPLSFVEELANAGYPLGVKLGPALAHEVIPDTAEAQWVSLHGSVVEAVLWFNLAQRLDVRRAALVIHATGAAELTSSTDFGNSPQVPVAGIEGATGYLYEPDGAVIRAGLVTDLMVEHFMNDDSTNAAAARQLDEHIAYFCSDVYQETPFATGYRIIEVLPYKIKTLRGYVKEHNVTRLDIKKRGVDVSPEELRRTLMQGRNTKKPASGEHLTLVLTRAGDARYAIVVQPI